MSKKNYLDSFTIKARIIGLVVITAVVLSSAILSVVWWKIDQNLSTQKRSQIENMTEAAVNVAKMYSKYHKSGIMSLQEAQKRTKEAVLNMRYDGDNYIWINDLNGKMLTHPKSSLIGSDFNSVKDKQGKYFITELINQCKQSGSGSTDYWWTKPGKGENEIFPKISAAKSFNEWNWMFATGVYVDDIKAIVKAAMIILISITTILTLFIIISAYFTIGQSIINPISKLTETANQLANNDLTVEIEDDENNTEISELNRSFKKFITNFRTLISNVGISTQEVASGAQQMSAASEQTSVGAQQISTSVTQVADGAQQQATDIQSCLEGINQINELVQEIQTRTNNTVEISNESEYSAKNGTNKAEMAIEKIIKIKETSNETSKTINELGVLSQEIEQILELIKTIASQTNLLALNAAIEAARAGEHGKGFAVVADEVKKLAGESAEATDKITAMIKEIQNKTNLAVVSVDESVNEIEEGVSFVEEVGTSLTQILSSTQETLNQVQEVSTTVLELTERSENIVSNMEGISSIVEESAASTEEISSVTEEQTASLEEISASAQSFAKVAEDLQEKVSIFCV